MATHEDDLRDALRERPACELAFVQGYILSIMGKDEGIFKESVEKLVDFLGWRDDREHLRKDG